MTIQEAIEHYLKQIKRGKSKNTAVAYQRGLKAFAECLAESKEAIDLAHTDITLLSPLWVEAFLDQLRHQSIATEHLYTTAVASFYRYVAAQDWASLNLSTLAFQLNQRRSQGRRLHIFPEEKLERLLENMKAYADRPFKLGYEKLAAYRDRALLVTLADTGLRVSEACGLKKGDIDWEKGRAIIIGKGDKQAVVRFSDRALRYIEAYLDQRLKLDQQQGKQSVLPLFARHDKRASKKVLPMSARTAENIVTDHVVRVLGEATRGTITPHTFRHYFVTRVVRQHDIAVAQKLARHESINTTSGYTHLSDHEIDEAYAEMFRFDDEQKP